MTAAPVRYRRSPHLVCYWTEGRLLIHNFATGARLPDIDVGRSPSHALVLCRILSFFERWRPAEALLARTPEYPPELVSTLLRLTVDSGLLQRSDRPPHPAEDAMRRWTTWNPVAGFFHTATKNVIYADPRAVDPDAPSGGGLGGGPRPVKRYRGAETLRLPSPHGAGEVPRVLKARRSWRQFDRRPIELAELGTLLGLTWGIQHRVKGVGRWPLILKSSPSGGARHPLEAYVLAWRVAGVPPGLYHYAADIHRLELLRRGAASTQVVGYLPGQGWYGRSAALVFITAVFPRKQWGYPYARAYRSVLLEAGHFGQTFCLLATWLGLAPFCTNALADSRIERDLGLDGITESVVYAVGVGSRPPGVAWAPWPNAVAYAHIPRQLPSFRPAETAAAPARQPEDAPRSGENR